MSYAIYPRGVTFMPPMVEQKTGGYVIPAHRRSLIDISSSGGFASLGANGWRIADAIQRQITLLPCIDAYAFTCNAIERAASDILHELGEQFYIGGKAGFYSSEAEAVEAACMLAVQTRLQINKSVKIITRRHDDHGSTPFTLLLGDQSRGSVLVTMGMNAAVKSFDAFAPHLQKLTINASEMLSLNTLVDALVADDRASIVIMEPVGGMRSGISPPTSAYLREVRKLCTNYGAILIYNETLSGHYRTGKFTSWQTFVPEGESADDYAPDIVVLGRGITGGYFPVGAVALSQTLAERLYTRRNKPALRNNTMNNPIAAAAITATMTAYTQTKDMQRATHARCAELAKSLRLQPHIKSVQGVGSLYGICFPGGRNTDTELRGQMFEQGVSVSARSGYHKGRDAMFMLSPPIDLVPADFDSVNAAVRELRLTPVKHVVRAFDT